MALPQPRPLGSNPYRVSELLYYNMMTPEWLWRNATLDDVIKGGGKTISTLSTQDKEEMAVPSDAVDYDSLISVKLLSPEMIPDPNQFDLNVSVTLAADVTANVYDPLAIMISDGTEYDGNRYHGYAVGFQLQDISKYQTLGPFLAIEGEAQRVLEHPTIHENTKEALIHWAQQRYPERFEMKFVPRMNWGSCYCATQYGGVSLSKVFSDNAADLYRSFADPSFGLFLSVFRQGKAESYRVDYIEVQVTASRRYDQQNT